MSCGRIVDEINGGSESRERCVRGALQEIVVEERQIECPKTGLYLRSLKFSFLLCSEIESAKESATLASN